MPSIMAIVNFRVFFSPNLSSICEMIDIPMGTIMMAVAVFDIHIERNAAEIINPRIMVEGLPPIIPIIRNVILLWSLHFSMAIAIIKPPINKKIVLLIYMGAVLLPFIMPSNG